jgi:hypothetical protein
VPIILAILLVFLNKHSLGTSACPIYPMQKKSKNSWSPLPNLFHRVTGNSKHTIIISEGGRGGRAWDFLCLSVENPNFFKHQVD